jgi:BirA family transcriptional regulator, biotin operon repressor / biotin---[acetyl-CoA-carboxylase] ligase
VPTSPTSPPSRPALELSELVQQLGPAARWDLHLLDESPSTNAVAADYARAGRPEGFTVVADHQTAGRGRLDRTWETAPRAALTFSVLLAPAGVPLRRWSWTPLLAGVAVARAVRRTTGLAAVLKWPNDVLIPDPGPGARGGKVAGILAEQVERGSGPAVVVGIGINVSARASELPVDSATALELAGAESVHRGQLLAAVLDELAEEYDAWRRADGDADAGLRATYLELCDTVARQVRVTLPSGENVHGEATGIDPDGRLQVAGPGGSRTLGAGDVVHVRAP